MLKIAQKQPTERHWQALESVHFEPISLDLFRTYWLVSQKEIAEITGAPLNTVKKWTCAGTHQRPDFEHLFRLTLVHRRWLEVESNPR